jgi:membrane peptidoglycan carboxypeptidase
VSNPDLPGPYWQEPADSDYRSGLRGGRNGSSYPADGYRSDDYGSGRSSRAGGSNGSGHRQNGGYHDGTPDPRSRGRRASAPAQRDDRGKQTGGRASNGNGNGDEGYTDGRGWRSRIGRGGGSAAGTEAGGAKRGGRKLRVGPWTAHIADAGEGDYSGAGGIETMQPERTAQHGNGRQGSSARTAVTERPGRGPGGGGYGPGDGGRGGRGPGRGGMQPRYPRTRRERFKYWIKSGTWWRHWTWKKAIGVCFGFFAFLVLCGIGVAFYKYESTQIPTAETALLKGQSSVVYFSNGKVLGTFTDGGFRHQILQSGQIPSVMDQAMVAAEDRHFYTEGGISLTGTIRAALHDLSGNGNLQGASTITEQYVKNYYQSLSSQASTQSLSYKIDEIIVAVKIAHERSKSWILTQYLDTAPFGSQTYGVGAATQQYFGINLAKPGAQLSVARAAMLAAIPNNPAVLSPYPDAGVGYTMLVQRWQYVLHYMVADGAISQQTATSLCEQCALPQAEKVFNKTVKPIPPNSNDGFTGTNGYLMDMVEQELIGTYGYTQQELGTAGLKITTTFSPDMMRKLRIAVNSEKHNIAITGGIRFPIYDHFGSAVIDPKTGAILAIYGGPGYGVKHCRRLLCDYNMAEAPHQVGSSFKPYVLATAVSQGMNVQTSVLNGYDPICIPPDWTQADRLMRSALEPGSRCTQEGFWPFTEPGEDYKAIAVTKAAAVSSDSAFEDLAHRVGVQNIINMAGKLGVGGSPLAYPVAYEGKQYDDLQYLNKYFKSGSVTIALGAGELTPIEQASTFATFADDGVYHTPHVIARLSEANGATSKTVPLKVVTRQALTPAQAADVDTALSQDNVYGTAYPNAVWPGRQVIGKTGTLGVGTIAAEAWFIGSIPQDSTAVALWTNSQSENLDNLPGIGGIGGSYGGAWPATTWKAFMSSAFGNTTPVALPTPNYAGFTKWVQVQPPKKIRNCLPFQFKHCTNCPPGQGNGNGHGHQCGPSPNPSPTCSQQFPGQPCSPTTSPSPSPSTSCTPVFPGGPCPSTSPTPGASPNEPSPTAGTIKQAEEPSAIGLLVLPPLLLRKRRKYRR